MVSTCTCKAAYILLNFYSLGWQRGLFFVCSFTYILWWCWSSLQYRIRELPACRVQNGGVSLLQWSDHMAHSENDILYTIATIHDFDNNEKRHTPQITYWIQLLTMDRWVRSKIFFFTSHFLDSYLICIEKAMWPLFITTILKLVINNKQLSQVLGSKLHFPGETSQFTTCINTYKWLYHTYIFQTFIEDFHG